MFIAITRIDTTNFNGINMHTWFNTSKLTNMHKHQNNNLIREKRDFEQKEHESNPPANPSSTLNSIMCNNELNALPNIIQKSPNLLNVEIVNAPKQSKKLINKESKTFRVLNAFDRSAFKLKKLSNELKKPSWYFKQLLTKAPHLSQNISSICEYMKELVKEAQAQKYQLNSQLSIKPFAQFQLLCRFIRICAFKIDNIPRDCKEENIILKTEEKEFDYYRHHFPNPSYPSSSAQRFMRE